MEVDMTEILPNPDTRKKGMLVLTRRPGQSVFINIPGIIAPVEVMVLSDENGHVRLGFRALPEIQILRSELMPRPLSADSKNNA